MTIKRTILIPDLTPKELAEAFCDMTDIDQAEFFAQIRPIAANWPNSGWCGQACNIVSRLNPNGRYVVQTLADHLELSE